MALIGLYMKIDAILQRIGYSMVIQVLILAVWVFIVSWGNQFAVILVASKLPIALGWIYLADKITASNSGNADEAAEADPEVI